VALEPATRSRATRQRGKIGAGLAALALVLVGCSSASSTVTPGGPATSVPPTAAASQAPSATPAADLSKFYQQKIAWSGCGGGFQCGKLTVPMTYAQPTGATIQLAVIRLRASDPSKRIGSLVLNPGGPGGSGVDYARAAPGIIAASLRARYDVVGFDPRGVGASDPVHCLTDKLTDAELSADATPDTPAEVNTLAGLAKQFADGCATMSPALYQHIGTVDVARDVDVLRAALGDKKLYWFGSSYGTFIGATYADLFPTNVGRMVLDGAIDPTLTNSELARGQAKGFEVALQRFVEDCAVETDCPLPKGTAAGLARIRAFFAQLNVKPLSTKGGRPLTEALAMNAVLSYLYFPPTDWEQLRYGLASAFAGDGSVLLGLLDDRLNRGHNGHYQDNSLDALNAVNALDHTDRPGPAQIAVLAQQWAKEAPTWGAFMAWSNLPFAYWEAPATDAPHRITAPGSPPILVVGTTYDPATPYPWAQALAKQLSKGVLLTRIGDGHTAYGMGSDCIDNAVNTYLLTGATPPVGTICRTAAF
jgi:pimeloyl-ACP methyl ester carboxylesterase